MQGELKTSFGKDYPMFYKVTWPLPRSIKRKLYIMQSDVSSFKVLLSRLSPNPQLLPWEGGVIHGLGRRGPDDSQCYQGLLYPTGGTGGGEGGEWVA